MLQLTSMPTLRKICAGLVCGMAMVAAALAPAQTPSPATTAQAAEQPELHYTVIGTRLGNQLYWTVHANGVGELNARGLIFAQRDAKGDPQGDRYAFVDGVVRFYIGPEGYAELRQSFAEILDGKVNQFALDDEKAGLQASLRDGGANVLNWSGQPAKGSFTLSNLGLNEQGELWDRRFDEAWLIIARHMLQQRHPGIVIVTPLPTGNPSAPPLPTLSYNEKNIWTGNIINWQIDPAGAGWFETASPITIPMRTSFTDSHYIPKGRYRFTLPSEEHRQLRTALEPYVTTTAQSGTCEGQTVTDQPITSLNWHSKGQAKGSYHNTLGCRAYADRIRQAHLLIAHRLILPR